MSAVLAAPVTAEQVETILAEVCASFLAEDEPLVLAPPLLDADGAPAAASGWVEVHGPWTGVVVVTAPRDVATALAAQLWRTPADDLEPEDVRDALGELANVVGGGVKAVADQGGALGLPQIALETAHRPSGQVEVCRAAVAWRGQPLEVVVWMRVSGTGTERTS